MANSYALGFVCFVLLVATVANATQFKVGDANGWGVPDANAESYNTWAEKTRFQIGDQLLFVYPTDKDSVLLVEPSDYNACNTSSYDKMFNDGNTVFTFDRSGAFFFISGNEANCRSNEKLIVMVQNNHTGGAPAPSQPVSPPPSTPSSTPSQPESPPSSAPSPPTGTTQPFPSSANAPVGTNSRAGAPPPATANEKNGAAVTLAGFISLFGAYIGYAMLAI